MSKKRIYRICVYLLDPKRERILLCRRKEQPFINQYVAMSAKLTTRETPIETARNLVSQTTDLDFDFIGHQSAMPRVLTKRSVKIFPPFHVQVTCINRETDFVDFVYIAQAKAAPDFPAGAPLYWFGRQHLKHVSDHVKPVVTQILAITKG